MFSGARSLERCYGEEEAKSKCREDKDCDLWQRAWRFAKLSQVPVSCLSIGVGSNSIFYNGCTRNAVGSGEGSRFQMCILFGIHTSHWWQTVDQSWLDPTIVGQFGNLFPFFCLIPQFFFFSCFFFGGGGNLFICFFILLTTEDSKVSWTLFGRKRRPWCNSLRPKFRNGMLHYLIFAPEAPIQTFWNVLGVNLRTV